MSARTFLDGRVALWAGDCLDVLAGFEPNSFDAVVCDPPYHLTSIVKRFGTVSDHDIAVARANPHRRTSGGFMGKQWDGGDIAFQPATWAAVLRVLKPGGYLLAFASTRGFGRMSVAIEDGGFITHPLIAWVFGSGFPKATRIKHPDYDGFRYGGQALKPAIEPIYMGQKPFSEENGTANILKHGTGAINIDGCRVGIDVTGQRPYEIQSWEQEQPLCDSCAALAEKNAKLSTPATKASIATKPAELTSSAKEKSFPPDTDRQDIGCSDGTKAVDTFTSSNTSKSGKTLTVPCHPDLKSITETRTEDTTTSAICSSCQKPITASSTRRNTPTSTNDLRPAGKQPVPIGRDGEPSAHKRYTDEGSTNFAATPGPRGGSPAGRWPSNLIHDGSDEVLAAFPDALGQQRSVGPQHGEKASVNTYGDYGARDQFDPRNDSGSAARFFYTAKADAEDRLGSKHPTVKPLDLMQYLCRLVCPPNGTILDPFAGTGTTGEAAWREGFSAVLIEREAEYQADIARRMDLATKPTKRAAVAKTKNKLQGAEGTPLFGGVAP
jgi:DNA modification methylase